MTLELFFCKYTKNNQHVKSSLIEHKTKKTLTYIHNYDLPPTLFPKERNQLMDGCWIRKSFTPSMYHLDGHLFDAICDKHDIQ
jgi:hypothetical protein